jgi:hypothetical protein
MNKSHAIVPVKCAAGGGGGLLANSLPDVYSLNRFHGF